MLALSAVTRISPGKEEDRPPPAEVRPSSAKPTTPQATDPPIASDGERDVPDYDGRGEEPTTAGDVLIWIPRVVLSPLYLVSEFVIRRPLGWVVSTAEEEEVPQKLVDLFTFGPDNNIGIVPTGLVDFGFRPSVGLYFFYNDFLAPGNDLRARAATGGTDWLLLNFAERLQVGNEQTLALRAEYGFRPDWVFHGIGPRSGDQEARFKATRTELGLQHEARGWRSSSFGAFVTLRDVSFDPEVGAFGEEDPTVADEVARGRYPYPPGMLDGYTALIQGVSASLDTRRRRHWEDAPDGSDFVSPPGSGLRLQLRGEHGAGLRDAPRNSLASPARHHWLRYGATLGGFVDLTGDQRVLGLSLIADFADPVTTGSEIPFTEQVSLGGPRPMRGFLEGRLVDRSGAVGLLEYQWPVWVWLDGTLHYAVGNVFGEHLDGFDLGLLRQSADLGLRTTGQRDHSFEILFGIGTETFDDGAEVESFRFVVGATSGF